MMKLLALAVAGLVALNVKTIHTFRNFKPLVIRIDELGRAQALSYDSFAYKPEAKEAKYFLTQFVSSTTAATVTPSTTTSPNRFISSTASSPTTS